MGPMRRVCWLAVGVLIAAAQVSCRPYHMYRGESRSDAEVGTVTQTYAARMMTVDGRDTGVSSVFKLLPGEHAIEVEVYKVGHDVGVERNASGSTSRMQGKFRWYVCTCVLRLDVVAGEAYGIDGGEVEPGKWNVWATTPSVRQTEHSWAAVEAQKPPHCTCETELEALKDVDVWRPASR